MHHPTAVSMCRHSVSFPLSRWPFFKGVPWTARWHAWRHEQRGPRPPPRHVLWSAASSLCTVPPPCARAGRLHSVNQAKGRRGWAGRGACAGQNGAAAPRMAAARCRLLAPHTSTGNCAGKLQQHGKTRRDRALSCRAVAAFWPRPGRMSRPAGDHGSVHLASTPRYTCAKPRKRTTNILLIILLQPCARPNQPCGNIPLRSRRGKRRVCERWVTTLIICRGSWACAGWRAAAPSQVFAAVGSQIAAARLSHSAKRQIERHRILISARALGVAGALPGMRAAACRLPCRRASIAAHQIGVNHLLPARARPGAALGDCQTRPFARLRCRLGQVMRLAARNKANARAATSIASSGGVGAALPPAPSTAAGG